MHSRPLSGQLLHNQSGDFKSPTPIDKKGLSVRGKRQIDLVYSKTLQ